MEGIKVNLGKKEMVGKEMIWEKSIKMKYSIHWHKLSYKALS